MLSWAVWQVYRRMSLLSDARSWFALSLFPDFVPRSLLRFYESLIGYIFCSTAGKGTWSFHAHLDCPLHLDLIALYTSWVRLDSTNTLSLSRFFNISTALPASHRNNCRQVQLAD